MRVVVESATEFFQLDPEFVFHENISSFSGKNCRHFFLSYISLSGFIKKIDNYKSYSFLVRFLPLNTGNRCQLVD